MVNTVPGLRAGAAAAAAGVFGGHVGQRAGRSARRQHSRKLCRAAAAGLRLLQNGEGAVGACTP